MITATPKLSDSHQDISALLDQMETYRTSLVFVVGLYKTGTSLLTHQLEVSGYANPALVELHRDIAIGGRVGNYLTRESLTVRRLNSKLLPEAGFSPLSGGLQFLPSSGHLRSVIAYLSSLPSKSVLKDPRLCRTLPVWLAAARYLGHTPLVCIPIRLDEDLERAWQYAPYPRSLLRRKPNALVDAHKSVLELVKFLDYTRVQTHFFDFNQLVTKSSASLLDCMSTVNSWTCFSR